MFETKNVLMLVLSAGLLIATAGTTLSQIHPVFAIDNDCEENSDDSCQEENQKVRQENNCKIVNEIENEDKSDSNEATNANSGDITCWAFAQNPDEGEAIVDEFSESNPTPP